MPTLDPRIDAYIAKSADFARPMLEYWRTLVHEAVPEVEETIKWGMPHFTHAGILAHMGAFKAHCAFMIQHGEQVIGPADARPGEAMGMFGRVEKLADLPPRKTLLGYLRKAAKLNEQGVKRARAKGTDRPVEVPAALQVALDAHPEARAHFDAFAPSHRREYAEWIAEAKTDATRARRVEQAIEWLAEGKSRNWKYEKR
jgi:uncharacterized protein YdeI (YjbR/CyaY-like superfamily)